MNKNQSYQLFKFSAIILLVALFSWQMTVFAQTSNEIVFSGNIGGGGYDQFCDVSATDDGGYIVVGSSSSTNSSLWENIGTDDGIILKFDKDNKIEWSYNIGGSGMDFFSSVAVTPNGDFVVVGQSTSQDAGWANQGEFDALILKFNQDGTLQWVKSMGTIHNDFISAVTVDAKGNILLGGSFGVQENNNAGMYPLRYGGAARFIKCDQLGNILWQQESRDFTYEEIKQIVLTKDNGFFTVGGMEEANEDLSKIIESAGILAKYDANGNEEWKKVDHGRKGCFEDALSLKNGNLAVAGKSDYPMLAQYDEAGNLLWRRTINEGMQDQEYNVFLDTFTSVIQREDGRLIVGGYQYGKDLTKLQSSGDGSAVLVEYAENGQILSCARFGDATEYHGDVFCGDIFSSVIALNNQDILAVGASEAKQSAFWGNKGDFDGILVRLRETENAKTISSAYNSNPKTNDADPALIVLLCGICLSAAFLSKKLWPRNNS